jgi:quercetin dioxygenase-like cupin family protein
MDGIRRRADATYDQSRTAIPGASVYRFRESSTDFSSNLDMSSFIKTLTGLPAVPLPIPGATPDGITASFVNVDTARGMVTLIIHMAPGATIPAHFHLNGAESHLVLEGDFIEAGVSYPAGTYLTHAANTKHGPHGTRTGCKVLTVQTSFVDPESPDFHLA